MKFILSIECNNDSFGEDSYSRNLEIMKLLNCVECALDVGKESKKILDSNGNHVGEFSFVNE